MRIRVALTIAILILKSTWSNANAQGIFGGGKGDGFDNKRITVAPSVLQIERQNPNICQFEQEPNHIAVHMKNLFSNKAEVVFVSLDGKIMPLEWDIDVSKQYITIAKLALPLPGFIYVKQDDEFCYAKVLR
ncbi:MAG: hypothetical protein RML72_03060 [Bacteroidia bacterium]|nr:hypothetical protein [Bacteroidia bacterium]MDW8157841.1 hypothetical protein [Bacteroidia bacterium]